MFRTAAIALVALAAFDDSYLDGKYMHSVQTGYFLFYIS
jgi:hypothetical protein